MGMTIHTANSVFPWIGLCLIVVGLIIRWIAILTLRKYFTTNVAIRHPSYVISSIFLNFNPSKKPLFEGAFF